LDQLSQWNLTALWLIGIWERSPASQKIKQWTGNPEAVSSAYSVYDYIIANDLGGEEAFENFRHRAGQRGIRLAGDMVPNHMGIYSKWIIEHPDYFIQSDYPPFPNYRFTDGNLSENPDIQVHIEDGYWSRSDASVVFQRVDNKNGNVRYIYHGNDGTHMPWNDTAQLDFLKAEVREAVMETIFHVARKFSIIRFDAAMTLTKRHFQRLW
jgi:glycosidase